MTVRLLPLASIVKSEPPGTFAPPLRSRVLFEKRPRPPSRRRSPEEIAALGERLYEAICRHPGETMAVIAPVVGASPGELRRPSVLLRREGRVRSVGQRHAMRYFPLDE